LAIALDLGEAYAMMVGERPYTKLRSDESR
jgi:hypothetical protein